MRAPRSWSGALGSPRSDRGGFGAQPRLSKKQRRQADASPGNLGLLDEEGDTAQHCRPVGQLRVTDRKVVGFE